MSQSLTIILVTAALAWLAFSICRSLFSELLSWFRKKEKPPVSTIRYSTTTPAATGDWRNDPTRSWSKRG